MSGQTVINISELARLQQRIADLEAQVANTSNTTHFSAARAETIPSACLFLDSTGRIISVNTAFQKLLGYNSAEIRGTDIFDILCPPDHSSFQNFLRQLSRQSCEQSIQLAFYAKDSTLKHLVLDGKQNCLNGGSLSFLCIVHDVSGHQTPGNQLLNETFRYQFITETIKDVFWILDVESRYFTYVSPSVEQLRGFTADEVMSSPVDHVLSPEAFPSIMRLLDVGAGLFKSGMMKPGTVFTHEIAQPHKNGTYVWTEVFSSYYLNQENNRLEIIGITRDISSRKKTEDALKQRESYLSALVENQLGLLWLKDLDSRFLAVNTNFAVSCGFNDPQLVAGKTDLDVWPEDLAQKYREEDQKVISSGKPLIVEEPISVSDQGCIKWFETFKTPVFDTDGSVIGTVGFSREITERKQFEQKLHESEERLKLALAGADLATWDWQIPDDSFTVDHRWVDMLGYTQEEILEMPKSLQHLIHPDDFVLVKKILDEHCAGSTDSYQAEYRLLHKSGDWIWVRDKGRVLERDQQGNAVRVCGTHLDITKGKQSDEALWQSQELLHGVLNSIPERVFWKDKYSRYLGCNFAFAQDAGFHVPEEIIGKDDFAMGWRNCAEQYQADDQEVIRSGLAKLFYEETQTTPTGELITLMTSKLPLRSASGEIIGVLGTYVDISERKRAEEEKKRLQAQLLHAQKIEAIGTLAGGIAHDFNNILGAIIGYTEMARDDSDPSSTIAQNLDKVMVAGDRAAALVRQILAFSRRKTMEQLPLKPDHIAHEIIRLLRPTLPSTITIRQHIDPEVSSILADPGQIHQVLMNLCTNAFHAMEKAGGILDVSVTNTILGQRDLHYQPGIKPGKFVHFSVRDTGIGIPHDIQKKIFDPYFTTKEIDKGTGLGLSIVQGIVSSYNGFVVCDSEPSCGSTFHVYIPEFIEEMPKKTEDLSGKSLAGRGRILFVDDETILAELGKTMLERLGYEVVAYTDSSLALHSFIENPTAFDVVITDQTMPGLTGMELAANMLRVRPDIPIILCTGYSTLVNERKAKEVGIRGFIMKPLAKKDLASLLNTVLTQTV